MICCCVELKYLWIYSSFLPVKGRYRRSPQFDNCKIGRIKILTNRVTHYFEIVFYFVVFVFSKYNFIKIEILDII